MEREIKREYERECVRERETERDGELRPPFLLHHHSFPQTNTG